MNPAYLSLAALVIAIVVSCFSDLNVGVLALALAWIVGVYLANLSVNDVIAGFPVALFLTLAGVTMLFTQAQLNGTLDRIAHRAMRLCRGNAGLIPVMFFALGCALASLGPGNVSTAALLMCCSRWWASFPLEPSTQTDDTQLLPNPSWSRAALEPASAAR